MCLAAAALPWVRGVVLAVWLCVLADLAVLCLPQSCSDVLQERFAVEMKCSVALRLAALHIQERIYACAQPQKVSLKYIE